MSDIAVNEATMKAAANVGFSTATDIADYLVRTANIPFREAHHVAGFFLNLCLYYDNGDIHIYIKEKSIKNKKATKNGQTITKNGRNAVGLLL